LDDLAVIKLSPFESAVIAELALLQYRLNKLEGMGEDDARHAAFVKALAAIGTTKNTDPADISPKATTIVKETVNRYIDNFISSASRQKQP
jgi:hypothetical protein